MYYVQIILGYWVDDFYFCPIDKVIYNRVNLKKEEKVTIKYDNKNME